MLVQRVLMPGSGGESWTLLGDDGAVVEPAERYLALHVPKISSAQVETLSRFRRRMR